MKSLRKWWQERLLSRSSTTSLAMLRFRHHCTCGHGSLQCRLSGLLPWIIVTSLSTHPMPYRRPAPDCLQIGCFNYVRVFRITHM